MHKPHDIQNFVASGDIAERRIVCLGADCSAVQASEGHTANFGVTELACNAGAHVDVAMGGIAEVTAGQDLQCGTWVAADSNGKAMPADDGCTVLGVALDNASSGEYVPVLISPGRAVNTRNQRQGFEASGVIAEGRIVKIASTGKISQASATSDTLVGIAMQNAADESYCDVAVSGIAEVTAGQDLQCGTWVTADSNGKAVAASAGNNYVGMALTAAASGEPLTVSIHVGSLPAAAVQQGG